MTTATGQRPGLGPALRAWRERLDPAEAGLAANGTRRTPGLRREELALVAGVSIDYVIRLEQGRSSSPSAQVLSALARALRLSDEEQAHLFELAGQAPPGRTVVNRLIPASVRRLCDQLRANPLGVFDAGFGLLAWSPLWAALHGDPTTVAGFERNAVWRRFTDPHPRIRHDDEAASAAAMVADLRRTAGRYPDDPEIAALVAELAVRSDRFAELWARPGIAVLSDDHKTVDHPTVGPVEVDCDTLHTGRGDLRVVIYSAAPGSEAAGKLEMLGVLGTQSLPAGGG